MRRGVPPKAAEEGPSAEELSEIEDRMRMLGYM